MNIYANTTNGILNLRPNQDADFAVVKELQERLAIAANDDVAYIILDFSLAALVSIATVRVIIDAAGKIHRRRGCIAITGASQQFRSLLLISDVLKIVPAFQSMEEAKTHLLSFQDEDDPYFDDKDKND